MTPIIKGIPLMTTLTQKLFPKKTISVVINGETKEVIPVDKETFIIWSIKLILEVGVVYAFAFIMKQFGLTYDDIMSLFGLIK